ncbi:MAG TPA: aspartate--tRNA ligase [Candidatus Enteromonas pullicola]|uniref:Aspartate--tRNA ligase n=1 Tax=Candidatus Alloenteromonas pullicola TaxID=2840784 RepID=A0A9D1LN15_9FIRM|nr:aspartate--tRNA ligase [Candidatus Enteromonas pullicola]
MERTMGNGELRLANVGEEVTLLGWVANRRNLGGLLFIDLRDSTGIVQLTCLHPEQVPDVKSEYVIEAKGKVAKKDNPNKNLATGEVEVIVDSIKVINKAELTPFIIADQTDALEDTRLQYRYLDLRRPCLLHNLKVRAKVCRIFRDYFDSNGFLEVETPILNLSSPEGARDYLVPSRVKHGSFYALPQSPQLWKQLLMVGGVERYYQVAKCFRDEDLRADRQPEFTQLDEECSFLSQDQILSLNEGFLARVFKQIRGVDIKLPLRRMKYWDAMDFYGSDKPDTRYGLCLFDLKEYVYPSAFSGMGEGDYVRAIRIEGQGKAISRKLLDELNAEARKFGLKGLFSLKREGDEISGSFAKFLSEEQKLSLKDKLGMKDDELILFASSPYRRDADFGLGAIRTWFAKHLGLIKPDTFDLLWVVDFPMFDPVEGEPGKYVAEHHPFTRPRDEDLPLLDSKPEEVLAYAYDIVINGYEAGGGTLRIYDHDIQWKIFRLLGLTDEDVKNKFGWFIDAFRYGAPPHGGIAFGLERLSMILCGTDNIRDVIAFPKNLSAGDPLSHAPSPVDLDQLEALAIEVKKGE